MFTLKTKCVLIVCRVNISCPFFPVALAHKRKLQWRFLLFKSRKLFYRVHQHFSFSQSVSSSLEE